MRTRLDTAMPPLPPQPADVPWPTDAWPTGPAPDGVDLEPLLDEVMDPDGALVRSRARSWSIGVA